MNETLERLEPHTPAGPVSHILANYFHKFVHYWSKGAQVRFLGEAQEFPVEMPIERAVRWEGNARGTVVVRCYEGFVKWLKKNKGYKPLNFGTENEMLNEMAGLFSTYLIHNFWEAESLKISPLKIDPSNPQLWPAGRAEAAFSLVVEGHPVEIRFWMEN